MSYFSVQTIISQHSKACFWITLHVQRWQTQVCVKTQVMQIVAIHVKPSQSSSILETGNKCNQCSQSHGFLANLTCTNQLALTTTQRNWTLKSGNTFNDALLPIDRSTSSWTTTLKITGPPCSITNSENTWMTFGMLVISWKNIVIMGNPSDISQILSQSLLKGVCRFLLALRQNREKFSLIGSWLRPTN